MDRGAWWAAVQCVVKSRTRLKRFSTRTHTAPLSKREDLHRAVVLLKTCPRAPPGGQMRLSSKKLKSKAACWRRQWHPTPVLLPGESHEQRSLVGCSPWGREESDTTERLHFPFHFHASEKKMATHSSVLARRIPGTGGAWWAAVDGVAQSRTRLK